MSTPVKDNSYTVRATNFIFMNTDTFEQYTIEESLLGDQSHFLKEGTIVNHDDA